MADPLKTDGPMDYGPEEPFEGRRPWVTRTLATITVTVAVGGFAAVLVYAYDKGKEVGRTSVPPIIKAGPEPHKIRPETPGGMKIPNRDVAVYDRLDPDKRERTVERLLPMPEAPMRPPAPKPRVAAVSPIKLPPPVAAALPPRPPVEIIRSNEPASPRRMASASPVTKTDARPAPPAAALTRIAPASGGGYRVQIASLRSDTAARGEWGKLKRRHGDILGGLELMVERKDLGRGKGVYFRLQAGPLTDVAAARSLCTELKKRKVGCLVVRR